MISESAFKLPLLLVGPATVGALCLYAVVALAIFIGLLISLVFAFDRPFHGDLSIDPQACQFVREQLTSR